jgi:hypothetical protein
VLPRLDTASDREFLQSLLLPPLNMLPLRPRLSREGLGILDPLGPARFGRDELSRHFLPRTASISLTNRFRLRVAPLLAEEPPAFVLR